MLQTTETVGVPTEIDAISSDFGIDLNDIVGLSVGGVILLILGLVIGWKRSSNKPIQKRYQQYKDTKKAISQEIQINDKKQAVLQAEVVKADEVSKKTEEKINKIVDAAAVEVQHALQEDDPRETAKRIIQNWD